MEICAHAKLNLTLDVLGKRPDGYHDLRMVMQSVALCDHLSAKKYICALASKIVKHLVISKLARRRVGIHSHNSHVGKVLRKLPFHLLSSVAEEGYIFTAA